MTYVIVGGTGTLGQEIARQLLLDGSERKITIFSRDELKQKDMRSEFPTLNYVLGDIRDRSAVRAVLRGAKTVFLLAAIKHVDAAELNPLEAVKTNILGTVNVAEEAQAAGVRHVVFSNTDKATLPITTYGYTKALAQNYLLSLNASGCATRFSCFSWGNIVGSRGSVLPMFVHSLIESRMIRITDVRMSRFWLRIADAASFLLANYETAATDRAMIPPIKGATVLRVAQAIADILCVSSYRVETTGLRCTEKTHEVLESSHDGCLRSDDCEQYSDAELRSLLEDQVLACAAADEKTQPRLPRRIIRQPKRAFAGPIAAV